MTHEEMLAQGIITQQEYDLLVANKNADEDEAISAFMNPDIATEEAKFVRSIIGMPMAVKRKKGLEFAYLCRVWANSAQRDGDRQTAKAWRSLAWSVTNTR